MLKTPGFALNRLVKNFTRSLRQAPPWYKIVVSPDDTARAMDAIIQYEFSEIFNIAGDPEEAAMFSIRINGGTELYFSPGAGRIARSLLQRNDAVACEKPPCAIDLMVGHAASREKLFQEHFSF